MNWVMKMNDTKKGVQNEASGVKRQKNKSVVICIIFCSLMFIGIACCLWGIVKGGREAFVATYKDACENERIATYQKKYEEYKAAAEEKYHVANRVSIYVGSLQEEQKLEVLAVSDVEFIVENKTDNSSNITSWLEVPGNGTFVVDLKAGEYIVDEERANVLVRVPYPELVNVQIDYDNVQKLLFKDEVLNESYKVGEKLAKQQLDKAYVLLTKEFTSNQNYYLNAQEAAKHAIETLVMQLNPEVPNLTVDVEFYDFKE